jgi:hypothetical protein
MIKVCEASKLGSEVIMNCLTWAFLYHDGVKEGGIGGLQASTNFFSGQQNSCQCCP